LPYLLTTRSERDLERFGPDKEFVFSEQSAEYVAFFAVEKSQFYEVVKNKP
jgi:sarcosine oxidase gamma subunit